MKRIFKSLCILSFIITCGCEDVPNGQYRVIDKNYQGKYTYTTVVSTGK